MPGMRQPDCRPTSPESHAFRCHERQTNTRPTEDDLWAGTNDKADGEGRSSRLESSYCGVRNQAERIPVIPDTYVLDKAAGEKK